MDTKGRYSLFPTSGNHLLFDGIVLFQESIHAYGTGGYIAKYEAENFEPI